jgi:hypothetical protein
MKRWGLLLGALLLLALFVASREHFSATATIKNPSSWDAAELTRIKSMVTPASTIPDADIRRVVGGFWSVWDGATTRITLAQVNSYLDSASNLGAKRNEYRDLIQAYYIAQGQSEFQRASGYSPGADTSVNANPPPASASTPSSTVERPSTSTQSLRQLIYLNNQFLQLWNHIIPSRQNIFKKCPTGNMICSVFIGGRSGGVRV